MGNETIAAMPDDTPIWRYMDLTKFVAMLVSKTLWFAKTKYLEEKYEGFAKAKAGTMPVNDRLAKCITRTTGEGVTDVISLTQMMVEFSQSSAAYFENAGEHLYVNSWCAGAESMAMWEIYGSKGCGIALKSTVGRYKQSARFEIREDQYAFGGVEYEDDPHSNPALNFDFSRGEIPVGSGVWEKLLPVAFHKRICFDYEREWRGALYQDFRLESYGCNIDFELGELIDTVYVGPRADRFFLDVVGSVMEKFELEKPLVLSTLLEPAQKKMPAPPL